MNLFKYFYKKDDVTQTIITLIKGNTMKLSEVLTVNESIVGQLNKIELEVTTRLADLQNSIDKLIVDMADVTLTDAQQQSFSDVQLAVQKLDDINPDVVV